MRLLTNLFHRSAATLNNNAMSAFPDLPHQNGVGSNGELPSLQTAQQLPTPISPSVQEYLIVQASDAPAMDLPFSDHLPVMEPPLQDVSVPNLPASFTVTEPAVSSEPQEVITLSSTDAHRDFTTSAPLDLQVLEDLNTDQAAVPPLDHDSNAVPSESVGELSRDIIPQEPAVAPSESQVGGVSQAQFTSPPAPTSSAPQMEDLIDVPLKIARERDEDDADAPAAKRTRIEETETNGAEVDVELSATVESSALAPQEDTLMDAPASTPKPGMPIISQHAALTSAKARPWGPMTEVQSKAIIEGMRNLRKNKSVLAFKEPVNWEALKIPAYPTIITHPRDLSTMERELKDGKYASVSDYIADFEIMVQNAITFNGQEHVVAQSGMVLKAQFESQLRRVPEAGQSAPSGIAVKKQKPPKSSTPSRESKPKTPRQSLSAVSAPPAATTQNYAIGPNGVPTIRRDSTTGDGRPKREIHRPPPRDLPYGSAKPRKKKYQTELRFCDHVLTEMRKTKYTNPYGIGSAFSIPVDPVALGIPDYFKIIKKPMDFQTIGEKLNAGQYENAKDFEADVRLVFNNCYKFNPPGNPIHSCGKQYEELFDSLWREKSSWVSDNAPPSGPTSPANASDDDEEEEADDDDDEEDSRAAQMALIQQQLSALSEQAQALLSGGNRKSVSKGTKKAKSTKPSSTKPIKKSGSLPIRSDKKPKVKAKTKPVTNAQKQEISNRIGELPLEQVSRAADMIRASLRKIGRHDLAVSGDMMRVLEHLY